MKFLPKPHTNFHPIGGNRGLSLEGYKLASFRRRAAAFVIDSMIVIPIAACIGLIEFLHERAAHPEFNHIEANPYHGWGLISLPLYFGLWTYFGHGQTLGKKIMKIRVVSLTHEHLSLWHSIERALGYAASVLEGGFGFIQYFIHPNRQTVHDRIAETIVIDDVGHGPKV